MKQSRATDAAEQPDAGGSTQTPVSDLESAGVGKHREQEDDTGTQQAFKQDPNAPAHEKRASVEEQGKKPLDAADK